MRGELALRTSAESCELLAGARKALTEAQTLQDLAGLVDRAEVIKVAARKVGLSTEACNDVAEYKLDAIRAAGQLLAETVKHGGDRRSSSHCENLKIADFGIEHNKSSRWRDIGSLPQDTYAQYKAQARARGEITAYLSYETPVWARVAAVAHLIRAVQAADGHNASVRLDRGATGTTRTGTR